MDTRRAPDGASCTVAQLLYEAKRVGTTRLRQHISRSKEIGLRQSMLRGRGMEFLESRPYVVGDEMRTIDWRVSARLNKIHTKVFAQERGRTVYFIIDHSSPMFFGSINCFKSVLAGRVAMRLAQAALNGNDVIAGVVVNDHHEAKCPKGSVRSLYRFAGLIASSSQTNINRADQTSAWPHALRHVAHDIPRGALVFVISDFTTLSDEFRQSLAKLKQKADITALVIADPLEDGWPKLGAIAMADGRGEIFFNSNDESLMKQYKKYRADHMKTLEDNFHALSIPFIRCLTSDDLNVTLRPLFGGGRKSL